MKSQFLPPHKETITTVSSVSFPVKLKLTLKINSNKTHTRQNKKWPNFKPMNTGQTSFYWPSVWVVGVIIGWVMMVQGLMKGRLINME